MRPRCRLADRRKRRPFATRLSSGSERLLCGATDCSFGSLVPIDRPLSGARGGAPGRSPDSQVSRFPGRHLAARGRVSTVCGACVGPWKTGILKTCRPARPSRGLPLRSRARGVRCVPGVPEWPAAGQWRGGHGHPHGATPRVASVAREVTSQEGLPDAHGKAFAWADMGAPMGCGGGAPRGTPGQRRGGGDGPFRRSLS